MTLVFIGASEVQSSTPSGLTPVKPTVEIVVPDLAVSRFRREWPVLFIWSQSVTNFTLADVETVECTLSDFSGSGRFYFAKLTINADELQAATITVSANSVNYANVVAGTISGTAPEADEEYAFMYDTRNIPDPSVGNVSWTRQFDFTAMPDLDGVLQTGETSGGAYAGAMEIETLGNFAYIVVQLQKYGRIFELSDAGVPTVENTLITTRQAGAGLYRIDLTNGTYTLLKAYPCITIAARSLLAHDNKVYFLEGTYQAALNEGQVFTSSDNNDNKRYLVNRLAGVPADWKSRTGRLRYVDNSSTDINDVGLNWISAYPGQNPQGEIDNYYGIHGATATPLFVRNSTLHMVTGYGNLDNINDPDDQVSRVENWNTIKYDTGINRKIPELQSNSKRGFELVKEVALLANCVIGLDRDTFFMRPRLARQAKLAQILDASSTGDIVIDSFSEDFSRYPATGQVAVNKELMDYTVIDSNSINTYTRGYKNTGIQSHVLGDQLFWVDYYITVSNLHRQNPIIDIRTRYDTSNVKNRIVVNYASGNPPIIDEDDASIMKHGIREFDFDTELGISNDAWAKSIAALLKERYKNATTFLEVDVLPSPHIVVGNVVFLHITNRMFLSHPCEVVEVVHTFNVEDHSRSNTRLKLLSLI